MQKSLNLKGLIFGSVRRMLLQYIGVQASVGSLLVFHCKRFELFHDRWYLKNSMNLVVLKILQSIDYISKNSVLENLVIEIDN